MKVRKIFPILALFLFPAASALGQAAPSPLPDDPGTRAEHSLRDSGRDSRQPDDAATPGTSGLRQSRTSGHSLGLRDKAHFYFSETFLNPAVFTAPAFRAGLRMANPPSRGAYTYPNDWRQGAEGFGRNYGDAFAERTSTHTARFVAGAILREDPRYFPSSSHNFMARTGHALAFTFIDRSDSGRPMPAISNLAGAAAGGAVGMAYLPPGFDNISYAGRRAAINFAALGGGNVFREFAPKLPAPIREIFMLIGR